MLMTPRRLFAPPDVNLVVTVLLVVMVLVLLTTSVATYRGHALCLVIAAWTPPAWPWTPLVVVSLVIVYMAPLDRSLALATLDVSLEWTSSVLWIARHGLVMLVLLLRALLTEKELMITLIALLASVEVCTVGDSRPNMTRPLVHLRAPVMHPVMLTLKLEHLFLRRHLSFGRLVVIFTVTAGFRVVFLAIMEIDALYVLVLVVSNVVYVVVVMHCVPFTTDAIRIRVIGRGIRR